MRAYTVTEKEVVSHINVSRAPYPHVGLGEEGRGSVYTRVAVSATFADTLSGSVFERASVLRTQDGKPVVFGERGDDNRALVLVNVAAGYRGRTTWTSVNQETVPCPLRGKGMVSWSVGTVGNCGECWTELPPSSVAGGLVTHPQTGEITHYLPFPTPGVTVLAEGQFSQGAAGRMGNHATRLIIMEPGAFFRVTRHGRLYGEPAERIVFWDGESLRLGTLDEVFPPVYDEAGTLV